MKNAKQNYNLNYTVCASIIKLHNNNKQLTNCHQIQRPHNTNLLVNMKMHQSIWEINFVEILLVLDCI